MPYSDEVPSQDEQAEFWSWVMSHLEPHDARDVPEDER